MLRHYINTRILFILGALIGLVGLLWNVSELEISQVNPTSTSPQTTNITIGPDLFPTAAGIICSHDSSEQLIADAWQSLQNENFARALACSRQVIEQYTPEAAAQQRELGSALPDDPKKYPILNDVATGWLIQGETLQRYSRKNNSQDLDLQALAAYQFALDNYPGGYALYLDGNYWPVRQRAFCQAFYYFPDLSNELPAVYTNDGDYTNCYIPSGFMSDLSNQGISVFDMVVDPKWSIATYQGATAIQAKYSALATDWAGVYMQFDENNWGVHPGLNISSANSLTFWAKGELGGEKIEFIVGGINDEDFPYEDSLEISLGLISLTKEWKQHCFDLSTFDRGSIIGGFAWIVAKDNNLNGATFYMDEIIFHESTCE